MRRRNSGFSFMEVVVALALFALAGLGLMTALNSGAQVGERASEMRMATIIGSRVIDRLVATGYDRLMGQISKGKASGELKLAQMAPQRPNKKGPRRGRNFGLVADGFEYTGQFRLEDVSPGLLKVHINLAWQRFGLTHPQSAGQMELLRYVVDPILALAAREPLAGR